MLLVLSSQPLTQTPCLFPSGHTYIVYGPLLNGVTTTIFESTPVYPTPSRYWDVVDQHQITHLYTAPTAIRLLRRLGEEHVRSHSLKSLRVIGSVGEPINPEAWHWYQQEVGRGECAVVDTYWQTETGSIVITPIPGAVPTKPGSATFPFWGIEPVILECVLLFPCCIVAGRALERSADMCSPPFPFLAPPLEPSSRATMSRESSASPSPGLRLPEPSTRTTHGTSRPT